MNKQKSFTPKRTSTKEAVERTEKPEPRQANINVMEILANYHPERGEDYAIHVFYRSKRRNPFAICSYKAISENNEDATIIMDNVRYGVNIRTGVIVDRGVVA